MRTSHRGAAWSFALALLVLTACGTAPLAGSVQPREGRAGLQLSGTVDGRQVAISDGAPQLETGDCDPRDGPDRDVCFITRDIAGTLVVLSIENPQVLRSGAALPVAAPRCATPARCDQVAGVALVDLQVGVAPRRRATGGRLTVTTVDPGDRYVGAFTLEPGGSGEAPPDPLGGRVGGSFDVVPRGDS